MNINVLRLSQRWCKWCVVRLILDSDEYQAAKLWGYWVPLALMDSDCVFHAMEIEILIMRNGLQVILSTH